MNEFKLQHRQNKIPILHFDLSSDFYVSKQLLIAYVIMRRFSEVEKQQVFFGNVIVEITFCSTFGKEILETFDFQVPFFP